MFSYEQQQGGGLVTQQPGIHQPAAYTAQPVTVGLTQPTIGQPMGYTAQQPMGYPNPGQPMVQPTVNVTGQQLHQLGQMIQQSTYFWMSTPPPMSGPAKSVQSRHGRPDVDYPLPDNCPACNTQVETVVSEYRINWANCILCGIMPVFSCLGCWLTTLLMNGCKDTVHSCPRCKRELRIWTRRRNRCFCKVPNHQKDSMVDFA